MISAKEIAKLFPIHMFLKAITRSMSITAQMIIILNCPNFIGLFQNGATLTGSRLILFSHFVTGPLSISAESSSQPYCLTTAGRPILQFATFSQEESDQDVGTSRKRKRLRVAV
jgi:hypothetical protein